MLKVLTKALLFCSILTIRLPGDPYPKTLTLGNETQQKISAKKQIKRIKTTEEKELSTRLIDTKMRELLQGKEIQSIGSRIIRDFAGHDYVVARYGELGYGVLNVANDDIVELAPFSPLPFDWESDDVRYVPWVGYYEKKDGRFFNTRSKEEISDNGLIDLEEESVRFVNQSIDDKNTAVFAESSTQLPSKPKDTNLSNSDNRVDAFMYADHEVPNSWYFKRNYDQYPENPNNICGYVSASLLLAYNEIFNSTGYFSKAEASKYIKPYQGTRHSNGWDGVPELIDSFPWEIWGEGIGESVPSTICSAINSFLSAKDKKYDIYKYYWEFSTITDPIKDGMPAAYFGNMKEDPDSENRINHVVTVYGYYDDGRLLCHYGWDGYSQVIMSQLGTFSLGGVVAIYNKSSHLHNRYFSDRITKKNYCGCGVLMEC